MQCMQVCHMLLQWFKSLSQVQSFCQILTASPFLTQLSDGLTGQFYNSLNGFYQNCNTTVCHPQNSYLYAEFVNWLLTDLPGNHKLSDPLSTQCLKKELDLKSLPEAHLSEKRITPLEIINKYQSKRETNKSKTKTTVSKIVQISS